MNYTAGNTSTQDMTVVVGATNHAPVITSTLGTVATQNLQYRYQVTVSDSELAFGDVMTYSLGFYKILQSNRLSRFVSLYTTYKDESDRPQKVEMTIRVGRSAFVTSCFRKRA